jgi:hypothetical protein
MVYLEAGATAEGHIRGAIGTAEDGVETVIFLISCLMRVKDADMAVHCLHI